MDRRKIEAPYEFRWARAEEWTPAIRMVWTTFMKFEGKDYTEEGIQKFFEFITDEDLYISFLKGEYRLMVVLDKGNIIGAGAVRNRNFLSILFVHEAYHYQGIGSMLLQKLCDYLKTERGEPYMFVHAAPYAVDFYRKQGFRAVHQEIEFSGIRVTPMEKMF